MMPVHTEKQHEKRRAAILARVSAGLDPELQTFAGSFLAGLSLADLEALSVAELVKTIETSWEFTRQRLPGQAKIRLSQPEWTSAGTIIDIVNDNMPFLVDSVTACLGEAGLAEAGLGEAGLTIVLVIHPVISVERNDKGERGTGQVFCESIMQLRLYTALDSQEKETIEQRLATVLADVRAAVEDWPVMLRRLRVAAAEIDAPALRKTGMAADDIAETEAFLAWLYDRHFTLLGYRHYHFTDQEGQPVMRVAPGSGLGILRDSDVTVFDGSRNLASLPPDVRAFLESPALLYITKGNAKSTVQRAVSLDVIGIKELSHDGRVVAERRFVGLFTAAVYSQSPRDIPLLRRKLAQVFEQAALDPLSHDGMTLARVLENYPRDELFQLSQEELLEFSLGIMRLHERLRIALFCRLDPFERFVSALIFVPRDRYDAPLRDRLHQLVAEAYGGVIVSAYIQVTDAPLAMLHVIVRTSPGAIPAVDPLELEARLIEAGRHWGERLFEALIAGEPKTHLSRQTIGRYVKAFPVSYTERFSPQEAIEDIVTLESTSGSRPVLRLDRAPHAAPHEVRLRLYRREQPIALSDILPILEHMGFRVLTELPHQIERPDIPEALWIQELCLTVLDATCVDIAAVSALIEAGFGAVWIGITEDDSLHRLILKEALDWRQIMVLRAYIKYLRQIGFPLSQDYIERTLIQHSKIVALLVQLFDERFNPAHADHSRSERVALVTAAIESALDTVRVLDEDRILRYLLNLLTATLRTNYYQTTASGEPKSYLSLKLDSLAIANLPKPRPLREIWVYSPMVEAIHLRGGLVARGGIRWSDRREDFRTEVLSLMRAQMVKNAVIVPVGSKGGFVVKNPPPSESGRAALQSEVVACYRIMMRGLLDVTDNYQAGVVVAPAKMVCHDQEDPYLVVAADKGTASFSDIANGISHEYGFWLDDAFASGGSAGYDHKAMGITARGAWIAVERHFREAGVDLGSQSISVAGIGDMAGDVFGNGMLHSNRLKLVAAFNHRHIFLDPDPDPAASFLERKRLFDKPGSSWADYDASLISPGGGVFERSAKRITLAPAVRQALGTDLTVATPMEIIRAILGAPVDLLWFGGIGTYIRAEAETNTAADDRANDGVRITGVEVRARVIGEGANLGVTQRGRIEYALQGGRINTDAIDNSAGVDTSDHEVNLKILLGGLVGQGDFSREKRNALLASVADEVAAQVLRDNYLQSFALSMAAAVGAAFVESAMTLMAALKRDLGFDRALEAMPDDAALALRRSQGRGLCRPELCVLMGWTKTALYNKILASDLPDDPSQIDDLARYFPTIIRNDYQARIADHGLRRELIATLVANELVNRAGLAFVSDLEDSLAVGAPEIARAFLVARDLFALPALWLEIEALDRLVEGGTITADRQLALYRRVALATEAGVRYLIGCWQPGAVDDIIARLAPALARLKGALPAPEDGSAGSQDIPESLAKGLAGLETIVQNLDVLTLAEQAMTPVDAAARAYSAVGELFGLNDLRDLIQTIPAPDSWARRANSALAADLGRHQQKLAHEWLVNGEDPPRWHEQSAMREALLQLVLEAKRRGTADLARMMVAEHMIQRLVV